MSNFKPELSITKLPTSSGDTAEIIEGASDMLLPSVSFDRALSHFAGDVQAKMQAIHDFYYNLPHPDKVPIDQLHIHFSAARPVDNSIETLTSGYFNRYGTKFTNTKAERKITPELEPTEKPTIRVFVGSAMPELFSGDEFKDTDTDMLSAIMSEMLSETLAHELAHFAQTAHDDMSLTLADRAKHRTQYAAAKLVIGTMRNKSDLVIGSGVIGISEVVSDSHVGSVITGLGAAVLSLIMNRKRRLRQHADATFERYQHKEVEVDAREHQSDPPILCTVNLLEDRKFPTGYRLEDFIKPENEKTSLYLANTKHRELSLTPRGREYKEIQKAAIRSEFRAIKIKSKSRRSHRK